MEIGQAELYRVGSTQGAWAGAGRRLIRGIQRNLYTTSLMLPMVLLGILLLMFAGRNKALFALLCVPIYYLLLQSAFHTEYRYILAIHYFLFIMAATAIYIPGKLLGKGVARIIRHLRRKSQAVV